MGFPGDGILVALPDDAEKLTHLPDREGPSFPKLFYLTFHGAHTDSRCGLNKVG